MLGNVQARGEFLLRMVVSGLVVDVFEGAHLRRSRRMERRRRESEGIGSFVL